MVFFSNPFPQYSRLQLFLFHSNSFRGRIVYFNALFLPARFSASVAPLHERHFCLTFHSAYENNTFHASPLYCISSHWKVNSIQPHWGCLIPSPRWLGEPFHTTAQTKPCVFHCSGCFLTHSSEPFWPVSLFHFMNRFFFFFKHRGPLQWLF